MKYILTLMFLIMVGCTTYKPVSSMSDYQLRQEYLDIQYEISEQQEELLRSQHRVQVPQYQPTPSSYTTRSRSNTYGGTTYTTSRTTPNYIHNPGESFAHGALTGYNLGQAISGSSARGNIKKLNRRLYDLSTEMTIRGVGP